MTSRSPVESSELDSSYTIVEFQASRIEKIPSFYILHSLRVANIWIVRTGQRLQSK